MKHSKIGGVAQKIISTVFFLATFACLFYFFYSTKYLPFFSPTAPDKTISS